MAFMNPVVLAALLLLPLSSCIDDGSYVEERSQPIINGQACTADESPQTVALIVDATLDIVGNEFPIRTLMCTGTLIAPDTVLTAAHCLDPAGLTQGFGTVKTATYYISRTEDLTAMLQGGGGQSLPALPADALPVRSVVAHPDFSLTGAEPEGLANFHDIGLMFLKEPITDVEPAIIMTPEESKLLQVGDEVRIAGWGQQTPSQEGPVGAKHCATANIFELGDFEMQIGDDASTARKCHGDSGGPTYITIETDSSRKERVIGATSRAYDASDCQRGGVDTMPSAWYEWIDDRMSEQCDTSERSWCEVSGVVEPSFYDEDGKDGEDGEDSEDGGCNTGGSNASGLGLLLLAFTFLRRRESNSL